MQRTISQNKRGMTLMEVILALAILGGSVAAIGELARSSFQRARTARDMVQGELLADSIMTKVMLGIIEMETVIDVPIGTGSLVQSDVVSDTHAFSAGGTGAELWLYSVEVTDISLEVSDLEGFLVEIAVTVRQNVREGRRAMTCRLVRWLALEPEEEEEEAAT